MLISHTYKFIFVHIQKTGGSSIEYVLRQFDPTALREIPHERDPQNLLKGRHVFARDIRDYLGSKIWNSYFKFAFVRNPWDRLVSWYNMIKLRGDQRTTPNNFWRYVLTHSHNFETFIKNCTDIITQLDGDKRSSAFNQIDYICDEDGQIIIDYIGRYENLEGSFKEAVQLMGLPPIELPHKNRFIHRHYSSYYNPQTKQIIAQRVQRDIDIFGYQFEQSKDKTNLKQEVTLAADRIRRSAHKHWEKMTDAIRSSVKKQLPGLIPHYRRWKILFVKNAFNDRGIQDK